MKFPFSSEKTNGVETLRHDVKQIKEDVQHLGRDVYQLAKSQLIRPVSASANEAKHAMLEGVHQAREKISACQARGHEALAHGLETSQHLMQQHRDRAVSWVRSNPLAAIGAALVAGLILSALKRDQR